MQSFHRIFAAISVSYTKIMRLSELRTGEKGIIIKVMGRGAFRKRIIEMGFIRGKEVQVIQNAPLKDPIHYRVMGYLSLIHI